MKTNSKRINTYFMWYYFVALVMNKNAVRFHFYYCHLFKPFNIIIMRKFIITSILVTLFNFSFSSTVYVDVTGVYDGSQLDVGGFAVLSVGDSVIFNLEVDSLVPSSGNDSDIDTINTNFRIRWANVVDGPASYEYGVIGIGTTGVASGVEHGTQNFIPIKLVEGRINQIYVVLTEGTSASYAPGAANYIASSTQVISNVNKDLLTAGGGVQINNPVRDGQLSIVLNENISSQALELITMQGEIVKSFSVKNQASIDVSHLNSGVYILRDTNTMSMRKIIIQ